VPIPPNNVSLPNPPFRVLFSLLPDKVSSLLPPIIFSIPEIVSVSIPFSCTFVLISVSSTNVNFILSDFCEKSSVSPPTSFVSPPAITSFPLSA